MDFPKRVKRDRLGMTVSLAVKPFREITSDGRMRVNLHPGQTRAHKSKARYVAVLAGSQGGKTCYGPHWLDREIRTKPNRFWKKLQLNMPNGGWVNKRNKN